ncbi:unnamed protein product [Cylicocyclus nassatus]|uniref:Saposin B-type domain-containing protein n=1 Tax=Cylicocyclus nassatus TaxID=53992 RepID=A0AA36HBA9_CYLNA|nr:unnamed protein product [Cylicocyclus nassatus]
MTMQCLKDPPELEAVIMKLLLILLLLSIFAITTCDEEVNKSFCGLCGHFGLQKIDFKAVEERCERVEHEISLSVKESCAALKKLSKETREAMKEKLEKLTWYQACTKICKHRICILPKKILRRRRGRIDKEVMRI